MEHKAVNDQDQQVSNSFSKKISWLIGAVVLMTALTWGIWYLHELQVTVSTDDAQVTGDIADISPEIAGRLEQLFVKVGDTVNAGEQLAELDNTQLAIAMNQAAAVLKLAQANYAKLPDDLKSAQAAADKAQQGMLASQGRQEEAEIALGDARRSLAQATALNSAGAVSQEALDSAQSRYRTAQAAVTVARSEASTAEAELRDARARLEAVNNTGAASYQAQVEQAQAAYDNAKSAYDKSIIHATIGGTVLQVAAVAGENLVPDQNILSISNLQAAWVSANVKETDYGRLRLGQKADVRIDAYAGKVFAGKVIELGRAAQSTFSLLPSQNDEGNFTKVTQRVPIKIEVDQAQLQQEGILLTPGMSAEVKIHTV